ncbi:hypothetical protein [Synechocystis sp. PCC 7509]|uniref:hypothetical protein n=1 Tax=Synechocystis sp. PCC 7509 TaxID=927677 RepID=UPI0002AD0C9B|nr:hypothetical protein [Synechocystis sp. PCC 7509]
MNVQWQRYKELELVPDNISAPKRRFELFPLAAAWRSLVNALMWEHFYEHRTDYLERCWELNEQENRSLALQKLLRLMN